MEGPPFDDANTAVYFHAFNRNKQSIALNFATPEGRDVLAELIAQCDIFAENYVPGKLAKYGLSYDDVKSINPNIIYASLSGWGQEGPYAQRAGYDIINASFGGLLSITGHSDGPPAKVGVAVTDLLTGALTAAAILAAMQRPGPSWVQASLFHTQSTMLSHVATAYLTKGIEGERYGTAHANLVPYQSFACSDGQFITVGAGNNAHFEQICSFLNLPHLPEQYPSNPDRVRGRDQLLPLLESTFLTKTCDEWLSTFATATFPYGPVNTISQAYADNELLKSVLTLSHELSGQITTPGSPIQFDAPLATARAAPMLGEHTAEVLTALTGLSPERIRRLTEAKTIQ